MSDKTIADKMFLKNATSMAILNGAAHPALCAQMPAELLGAGDGVADVVLMFALDQRELDRFLPKALARLGDKGALWVGYLKGTASRKTDINRDTVNATAETLGATAVSIIAIDQDWSALRLKRV